MQKWEYQILPLEIEGDKAGDVWTHSYGQYGWELVSVVMPPQNVKPFGGRVQVVAFFKRPVSR